MIVAVERNFDPAQLRDDHGRWTDGPAGAAVSYTLDAFEDLYGAIMDDRYAGDFYVSVHERGDFVLSFVHEDGRREILLDGLDADRANAIADGLDWAATAHLHEDDVNDPDTGLVDYAEVDDEIMVGYDNAGNVSLRLPKGDDPMPGNPDDYEVLDMDAGDATDLERALRDMAEAYDELEDEDVARHLPGLHDQSSHGRRFKVPGNPKSGLKKALKATKGKSDTRKVPAEKKFAPKTVAELQKSQDDYLARTGTKLTEDQRFALKAYSLAAYEGMNGWLRGRKGYENPPEAVRKAVADAKAAMLPLQVDTAFQRGTGWDGLPEGFRDPESAKRLVGRTIEDPGFLSTSVPGARLTLRGDVKLTVEAPKGTMGRLVRDVSEIPDEDEYIFAPGTRYEVLEVSGENPTHVTVRAVSP